MARALALTFKSKSGTDIIKFHGSVFGGCMHGQVLALQGLEQEPVKPHLQKIFDAGHASEAATKQWFRDKGFEFTHSDSNDFNEQFEVALWDEAGVVPGKILLASHPDGVIRHPRRAATFRSKCGAVLRLEPNQSAYIEHKCLGQEKWELFQSQGLAAFERYSWQVSAAYHGIAKKLGEMPILFSVERREYDAGTHRPSGERTVTWIPEVPFTEEQCLRRCHEVVEHWREGRVPDCDAEYPCSYAYLDKVQPESDDCSALDAAAQAYLDANEDLNFAKESFELKKADLLEIVGERSLLLTASGYQVQNRVDKLGRKTVSVRRT